MGRVAVHQFISLYRQEGNPKICYMCWKMLEITCKKKQIFGQAFSKGFRDGISWYLADLSKAQSNKKEP
jgi:hypothetical protein